MIFAIIFAFLAALLFIGVGGMISTREYSFAVTIFIVGAVAIGLAMYISFYEGVSNTLDLRYCPVCDTNYSEEYTFCPEDGAELKEAVSVYDNN